MKMGKKSDNRKSKKGKDPIHDPGNTSGKTSGQKRPVLSSLVKVIRFIIGLAIALLIAGFGVFYVSVSNAKPPETIANVDGVVVLTGTGGGRLEAAAQLLSDGHGERLLVSGINPAIDAKTLQGLLKLNDKLFTCCTDLDYVAENTFGNGQETAIWARALSYDTILLVTSSYHMPRAKVEIGAAHTDLNIIAYPVKVANAHDAPWWGGKEKVQRLSREYGKLLVAYAREPGSRRSPGVPLTETPIPPTPIKEGQSIGADPNPQGQ